MSTISIELPDSVYSSLRKDPNDFIKEMRLAAAVKWYEMGMISQERAAEIAGITRSEFLTELARFKIDFIQLEENELEEELRDAD